MLIAMCFQVSELNIYYPYGCHLKVRNLMQQVPCLLYIGKGCFHYLPNNNLLAMLLVSKYLKQAY
jgi:hypothetical protein